MPHRASHRSPDVSFILSVANDEETVGYCVRDIARHLGSLGMSFEILAVGDGCTDNSLSLLRLMAAQHPDLHVRVVAASRSGRAFVRGIVEAKAPIVAFADASRPMPLAPLGWALGRLGAGREAILLRGRYVVARRLAALPAVARASGRGATFERSFERHARNLGLQVAGTNPRHRRPSLLAPLAPVLRLLSA